MSIFSLLGLSQTEEKAEKLLDDYSLRITPHAKQAIEKMPKPLKQKMNQDIRGVIQFYAYLGKFSLEGDE